jgi:hypothetical protein
MFFAKWVQAEIPKLKGFYHFYHYDQRESQICHFTDRNLNLAIVHLKHSSVLPFCHVYR